MYGYYSLAIAFSLGQNTPMQLTIIIPALNEAESIDQVLMNIKGSLKAEILVVDGGSEDATAAIAEAAWSQRNHRKPTWLWNGLCGGYACSPGGSFSVYGCSWCRLSRLPSPACCAFGKWECRYGAWFSVVRWRGSRHYALASVYG